MARPPLPLGTWGQIATRQVAPGVHAARARYRDFDGVTRTVERRGASKAAATRSLREALANRPRPAGAGLSRDSRLRAVAALYFAEIAVSPRVSQQTYDQYHDNWTRYIERGLGDLRVAEVTPGLCAAFLTAFHDRPATHTRIRGTMIHILDTAVRMDLVESNAAKAVKTIESGRRKPRSLSLAEVAELRELITEYDKRVRGATPMLLDILDVMLGTGLRISEVVPLRWDDIDPIARTITVSRHAVRSRAQYSGLAESRKGNDETFTLPIPQFVSATLVARHTRVDDGPWVFASRNGSFISTSAVSSKLSRARGEKYSWVTSHVFRKTVATLLAAERDADAAAKQLGHADSRVTRRHYIQRGLVAPDLTEVLELLGKR